MNTVDEVKKLQKAHMTPTHLRKYKVMYVPHLSRDFLFASSFSPLPFSSFYFSPPPPPPPPRPVTALCFLPLAKAFLFLSFLRFLTKLSLSLSRVLSFLPLPFPPPPFPFPSTSFFLPSSTDLCETQYLTFSLKISDGKI